MTDRRMESSEESRTKYRLDCNDCPYERTVVGGVSTIFDAIDDHKAQHGDDHADHPVDIEKVE